MIKTLDKCNHQRILMKDITKIIKTSHYPKM